MSERGAGGAADSRSAAETETVPARDLHPPTTVHENVTRAPPAPRPARGPESQHAGARVEYFN